eukprot:1198411-Rhodomonas_salina.1
MYSSVIVVLAHLLVSVLVSDATAWHLLHRGHHATVLGGAVNNDHRRELRAHRSVGGVLQVAQPAHDH